MDIPTYLFDEDQGVTAELSVRQYRVIMSCGAVLRFDVAAQRGDSGLTGYTEFVLAKSRELTGQHRCNNVNCEAQWPESLSWRLVL